MPEALVAQPGVNSLLDDASNGPQCTPSELIRLHNELLAEFPGCLFETDFSRGNLMVKCVDCVWGLSKDGSFRLHAGTITHQNNVARKAHGVQTVREEFSQGDGSRKVNQEQASVEALPFHVKEEPSEEDSHHRWQNPSQK
jgi:hypothetical protein